MIYYRVIHDILSTDFIIIYYYYKAFDNFNSNTATKLKYIARSAYKLFELTRTHTFNFISISSYLLRETNENYWTRKHIIIQIRNRNNIAIV